MTTATIPEGTIHYRVHGEGEPIVLVHGLLADGELWRDVVPLLAANHRVIVPDWPLGSHRTPMRPQTDLSPPGLAKIVAGFLEALDLEDVTLVANDTGGAISQIVAVNHPQRLARLVLTNCDAFENFLPPAFKPLQAVGYIPGGVVAMANSMRPARVRRLPMAYGMLTKRPIADELTAAWVAPAIQRSAIRREIGRILRGISKRHTLAAAERFGSFDKPVLLAWAPEDRMFKVEFAQRVADAFPNARLELIEDCYTFVPLDQPQRLAELIVEFVDQTPAGTPSPQPATA